MTSRRPYRVSAYNTSKQSENKIHDDTVARQFGFSGGLVPGVDVLAYMIHLPVAKWGRAFLERGLIEARFVKPVYDGEIAEVTGEESDGVLSIEVESRGELCATGTRVAAGGGAVVFAVGFQRNRAGGRAQAGQCGVLSRSANGSARCRAPGPAMRQPNISPTSARPMRSMRAKARPSRPVAAGDEQGAGRQRHPRARGFTSAAGCSCCRRRAVGDEITARAKVTGNYDKKGHRFVELDALVVANGKTPLAHCQHIAIYQPREQAAA